MSFEARLSPARVSVAAALAFPRWALWVLLVLYIGAGLFGRDPWGAEDAAGFGVMWFMAHGAAADLVLPVVAGDWSAEEGPLPSWVGALFIALLGGWLGDPLAARLTTVLWFAVATTALWYATYRLARRDEAQPVTFAFGGEAAPRDYGRMLADMAVLLLLGTVGIALRMHETTAETVALAFTMVALFGLAWSLERPRRGALVAGLAVAAVALSRGPALGLWLLAGVLAALALNGERRDRTPKLVLATAVALGGFAVWPLLAQLAPEASRAAYWSAYRGWLERSIALPGPSEFGWLPRNLAWYLWPLWPLAAWTLYAWRHLLRTPHVQMPALVLAATLGAALTTAPLNEAALAPLVPPLLVLAVFGAASLRRSLDTLIDWFAMATFSLFALAAWAYFIAWQTGTPPRMAASVLRLVPGFDDRPPWPLLALAALATAGWVALVVWRIARRPPMLWTGPLLAGAGLTMLWLLLTTLFIAAVNYNRSARPIALQVAEQIRQQAVEGQPTCVRAQGLNAGQRAMFAYVGGIDFGHPARPQACELLLQRDSRRSAIDDALPPGDWRQLWVGSWPARRDELIRLHQLAGR
jgi:4-amino-4-deoxy-L-arabinose transferase-like glycosyltransferase